ncbi:hypothetical protein BaRGS_00016905 [Batillaria attramentaria]|uniref:Metalloendopeptidase n=1 Tax=Batillaria attramentaria TaxID=370345 RepID=A0ABD0KXY1_9CAEN
MKAWILLICVGLTWALPPPADVEFRNAIRGTSHKWSGGIVPYVIQSSYPSTTKSTILAAMREIESNTRHGSRDCIKFVPRTNQHDYIYVQKGTGCHSKIGHVGGQQEVSIGTGCERKGTIMHELNHALGFWHEQNRYDRDTYVVIHTSNIDSSHMHDFTKHSSREMDTLGTDYDYGSIMHYGAYTFAVNKALPSISPKPGHAAGVTMGQRLAMSKEDVTRIQKQYGCPVDTTHIAKPSTSHDIVNCNFDASLCNLHQDTHDNFDWTRRSGHTPTSNTGPNADHTNSAGEYIFAEANGHHRQRARLTTPTTTAGAHCIDFYLFQHGSQEGSLQVLAAGTRIREQAVKTISGDQKAEWRHFRINLNVPADFHLILQANIGSGDSSDIAVDDFNFYKGRCVLAQRAPAGSPGDTYIAADYVKFLESAGARVVPIFAGNPEEYYTHLFNNLNGVLLPGGDVDVTDSLYAHAAQIFYNLTIQFLASLTAGRNMLKPTDSFNFAAPLYLQPDYKKSRLLGWAPADVVSYIGWENVTENFHHDSVLLMDFQADNKLSSFYRVISYNTDRQGQTFASTIEAFDYPIYGSQWHPESTMFGWAPNLEINHSAHAVRVSQYIANFIVQEARRSLHHFPSALEEVREVINNYNPVYRDDGSFVQDYFFNLTHHWSSKLQYLY